jgi:glycosyltransferase involved in cell wall biosynthesis
MKIGIALPNHYMNEIGGSEIQVKLLIDEFISNEHQVSYITFKKNRNFGKECPYTLRYITKPPGNIKVLNYINKQKLFNILDQEKVDVLYQRGNYHFADLISKYGKMRGIPVFTGLSMISHAEKKKLKLNAKILFDIIEKFFIVQNYYRFSTVIISQTMDQRDALLKNYNLKSKVIYNGHIPPPDQFNKEQPRIIVWIANIKPWKRPEIFVELAKINENKNFKFIMVGRPNKNKIYQQSLKEKIKYVKNLEYLGELPFEKTNQLIEKSSLFVNTSENNEGFPNTYIQSWFRRVPVLALDFDPDDFIIKNKIGYLCKTLLVMNKKMNELILDDKELAEMGNRARVIA